MTTPTQKNAIHAVQELVDKCEGYQKLLTSLVVGFRCKELPSQEKMTAMNEARQFLGLTMLRLPEFMPPKTLKALKGSIRKWERVVTGKGKDEGYWNCPLCIRFMSEGEKGCGDCPVAEKTGETGCEGSPYQEWSDMDDNDFANTPKLKAIARKEVKFLKSLLP